MCLSSGKLCRSISYCAHRRARLQCQLSGSKKFFPPGHRAFHALVARLILGCFVVGRFGAVAVDPACDVKQAVERTPLVGQRDQHGHLGSALCWLLGNDVAQTLIHVNTKIIKQVHVLLQHRAQLAGSMQGKFSCLARSVWSLCAATFHLQWVS